jgi:hypothetical protein
MTKPARTVPGRTRRVCFNVGRGPGSRGHVPQQLGHLARQAMRRPAKEAVDARGKGIHHDCGLQDAPDGD